MFRVAKRQWVSLIHPQTQVALLLVTQMQQTHHLEKWEALQQCSKIAQKLLECQM
jgi:hypothetical protein